MTERVKNPFPGMNPWLEDYWPDVHAKFLVYACDTLNAELPSGLQARVDERLAIDTGGEELTKYRPDVAVSDDWDRVSRPTLGENGKTVTASKPVIVDLTEEILRHLEIVDSRSHIITAIELLSRSNKEYGQGQLDWSKKRSDYVRGGINFVEIDLLRWGIWILPDRSWLKPVPPGRIWYHACVTRPPRIGRHEFYGVPLRERLPIIRIPLRPSDPDVALDLQALIDQCYERGRYGSQIDYSQPPSLALPEKELAWAQQVIAGKAQ